MKDNKREVVVVMGAGRTGSSLLVNILLKMGMSHTGEFAPANEQNPEGFFEDIEILAIHKKLFDGMDAHPMLPVPDEYMESPVVKRSRRSLVKLIEERIDAAGGAIWGFKDPRVSNLIPLWRRVFSMANVVPKYILTVRDPASVITSMVRQNDNGAEFAELVWLSRNVEAIYQTGGNCFIVNYEDWFGERASELVASLANFVGFEDKPDAEQINKILESVVKGNLNRSQYGDAEIQNRYTHQLYEILKNCHGADFNREQLLGDSVACRKAMLEFSGWLKFAQKYYKDSRNAGAPDKAALEELALEKSKLLAEMKLSVMQANASLKEAKDYKERFENARIKALEDKKKLLNIRKSRSYVIGMEVVDAFRRPGFNTLKLPYRLIKHGFRILFVRK